MSYTSFEGENKNEYAHGVGTVANAPKVYNGKKMVCSFTATLERTPTDEKNPNGTTKYNYTLRNFTAFGSLAEYCSHMEKGDVFLFYARMEPDEYWTERNATGEVQYKYLLDFIMVQPNIPGSAFEESLPGGWGDMPNY